MYLEKKYFYVGGTLYLYNNVQNVDVKWCFMSLLCLCCPLLDDTLHYFVITRSSPFPAPPLWSFSVLRAFLPSKQEKMSVPKLSLCVEMGTNRKMWIITIIIRRRALMTDQADRPLTPLSSLEQLSSKDSRDNRSTWVDQMDSKGPVCTRPFPIVGIYGHVVLL